MTRTKSYAEAISLLNTCQSNAAAIEAVRKSGGRLQELGIPEMLDYLRRIGYKPDDLNALNVIHVTGTKGKGSTSAFAERIVRSHLPSSSKVGLYTSPHLCAVRERIRINGEPLSEEVFAKYFFEVWERLENDPKTLTPTTPVFPIYFRLLTLLAFHTFLSLGVDATVLEVGIGGTYDSTNIVPKPITTGVSSLGMDHTAILGNTIEEIARNKAGIYKLGVPALSVPQDRAGQVLENYANEIHAPFQVVPIIPETSLGIRGDHQRINASLAVGLAKSFLASPQGGNQTFSEILPESFVKPLAETKWPGRCQRVPRGKVTWLLDGAHTTESLTSCGEWAWSEAKPTALIFNCSGGRASDQLLGSLLQAGASKCGQSKEELGSTLDTVIFCTNVTYTSGAFKGDLTSNAIDPNDLSQLATQHALRDAWLALNPCFPPEQVHVVASIEHAVNIINSQNKAEVLVAGSLHLVGGVMEVAGLQDALGMN
ncbi:putative tetrahydrofolylpolyglutamate synthase [Kockovaella imperatae]|uniref:Folylpolyglutamate synthase n=1 Tax=Kockovaella imperatae TaxID=4999 RepID=A0A1Y1UDH8_9TREE|nr:putative tetrahydrofolylpolyglutamate synthase [Kockovaella imperatae]ORX35607.1 putative tetrahydrofolylpolyglutamate synthase [Kockovaella imperatae]